jgi:hypothetical protein
MQPQARPGRTIIRGGLKEGKPVDLAVTPESRRKDIVNHPSTQDRTHHDFTRRSRLRIAHGDVGE